MYPAHYIHDKRTTFVDKRASCVRTSDELHLPQVVASFLALLGRAAGGADPGALAVADWGSVPGTLPTIALAFVFQNVVPVIASSLEARCSGTYVFLAAAPFALERVCFACCSQRASRPGKNPLLPLDVAATPHDTLPSGQASSSCDDADRTPFKSGLCGVVVCIRSHPDVSCNNGRATSGRCARRSCWAWRCRWPCSCPGTRPCWATWRPARTPASRQPAVPLSA